jgi:hypothetical protein
VSSVSNAKANHTLDYHNPNHATRSEPLAQSAIDGVFIAIANQFLSVPLCAVAAAITRDVFGSAAVSFATLFAVYSILFAVAFGVWMSRWARARVLCLYLLTALLVPVLMLGAIERLFGNLI